MKKNIVKVGMIVILVIFTFSSCSYGIYYVASHNINHSPSVPLENPNASGNYIYFGGKKPEKPYLLDLELYKETNNRAVAINTRENPNSQVYQKESENYWKSYSLECSEQCVPELAVMYSVGIICNMEKTTCVVYDYDQMKTIALFDHLLPENNINIPIWLKEVTPQQNSYYAINTNSSVKIYNPYQKKIIHTFDHGNYTWINQSVCDNDTKLCAYYDEKTNQLHSPFLYDEIHISNILYRGSNPTGDLVDNQYLNRYVIQSNQSDNHLSVFDLKNNNTKEYSAGIYLDGLGTGEGNYYIYADGKKLYFLRVEEEISLYDMDISYENIKQVSIQNVTMEEVDIHIEYDHNTEKNFQFSYKNHQLLEIDSFSK